MKAPRRSMKLEAIWGRASQAEVRPVVSDDCAWCALRDSKQRRLVLEQSGQAEGGCGGRGRSEEPTAGLCTTFRLLALS